MTIKEKLYLDRAGLEEHGPITIVAFGDSVTHGALTPGILDYESVYWNRLRKKLNAVRSYVPVNVINAGISGIKASDSVARLDRQVLCHNPDLIIVCFGLNDVNGQLESYLRSMRTILERCLASGADVILLTPNMMNHYVTDDTLPSLRSYAEKTARYQTEGKLDLFVESAIGLARELDVAVCDCYAKWKEIARTTDVTSLLINRINHPTPEMHELFAESLFEMIMGEERSEGKTVSTMYEGEG